VDQQSSPGSQGLWRVGTEFGLYNVSFWGSVTVAAVERTIGKAVC
jgi:hypothetical protein